MNGFLKKYGPAILMILVILLFPSWQEAQIDTTSESYRKKYEIGYRIGEWLPFLVLITLVILVMMRARKASREQ